MCPTPSESRRSPAARLAHAHSRSTTPLFVVIGAPAVGKSTTSRALAARFPKSLHLPVDLLRDMVVSGLQRPGPDWSDALAQQVALARASAIQMALAYQHAGFVPVLDDFWDPHQLVEYQQVLRQPQTHKIVLYPSQQAAHQRNLQRSGPGATRDYLDEGIHTVYRLLNAVVGQLAQEGWLVVDTTALSVEATVSEILHQAGVTPAPP